MWTGKKENNLSDNRDPENEVALKLRLGNFNRNHWVISRKIQQYRRPRQLGIKTSHTVNIPTINNPWWILVVHCSLSLYSFRILCWCACLPFRVFAFRLERFGFGCLLLLRYCCCCSVQRSWNENTKKERRCLFIFVEGRGSERWIQGICFDSKASLHTHLSHTVSVCANWDLVRISTL